MDEQKAGQIIVPHDKPAEPTPLAQPPVATLGPQPQNGHTVVADPPENKEPEAPKTVQPPAPWQFKNETVAADATVARNRGNQEPVSWTASEFIAHRKSPRWYGMLAVAAIVMAAIVYALTRDKVSTAVVMVAAVVLGFYAARQPRELDYQLDDRGLSIGSKFYDYDSFKSFSVIDEGAFASITLMPLKRFMPPLTIYYAPDDEPRILNLLAERLPLEEHRADAIDHLMRRIRF